MKSGPGDGTGQNAPKGDLGLTAFQDAKPNTEGASGAGDSGTGPKVVGSRTSSK